MKVDFETEILAGHSAGAHVICEYLKESCFNAKALVYFSPVDGVDPFNIIKEYCIPPGTQVSYDIPTLTFMTGKDHESGESS